MKRILSLLFACFSMLCISARETDHNLWTMHLSYQNASQAVAVGSKVFVRYEGNLLSYNIYEQSVQTYDKLNGLSDKGITFMGWSDTQKCLVLIYENRNIDLLYENGDVINIPQVKNFTGYSINVTNLSVNDDWAVLSTTDGVIAINIPRAELKGYYQLGQTVKDATILNNTIFASLTDSCVKGLLTDNLYDQSQWTTVFDFPVTDIVATGSNAYLAVPYIKGKTDLVAGASYLTLPEDGSNPSLKLVSPILFNAGNYSNGMVQFVGCNYLVVISCKQDPLKENMRYNLGWDPISTAFTIDSSFWMINNEGKLINQRPATENTLEDTGVEIGNFGPLHDYCYKLNYVGNRLIVAGGKFDYTGKQFAPTAMCYENDEWTFFESKGFELNNKARYRNVTSIAQDPKDANHHYVSSSSGLLEFKDFKFVQHFNQSNSPIAPAEGASAQHENYNIIDGLAYDLDGNLWMTNYEAIPALKYLKPDGSWGKLTTPSFNKVPTPERILFDHKGRMWVTSRRTVSWGVSGLMGLDFNRTPDDTEDDRPMFRSSALNYDGNNCSLEGMNDICFDQNGQLWIGCNSGVYAITDLDEWFQSSFLIYQPKVPRNDGTNFADYLLTGIPVTAIAVDAGNRKWLGTFGSGVYLVSPDGSEVLKHFVAAETPLLSDNIYSLAVDPASGNVMIGTDKGLCAYQSHIVPPVSSLNKNSIKVYPNPVRPEYNGNVTITGLTDDAEVKVTTTGSQLVARGKAIGGTFEWDLRSSASGRRVAPGVYYLYIASSDGSKSIATKVVVM